jgi:hypothetical protein
MSARSHRAAIPVKGTDTRLIPGQDPFGTTPRDNGRVQSLTTKGTIMNNIAKMRKTTVAGVLGLTAAGMAATIALANGTAAEPSDFGVVEEQQSAPVDNYSGPRSADAAEGWLKRKTAHLDQQTPDSAKVWIDGVEYTGPRTADAAEHWIDGLRND